MKACLILLLAVAANAQHLVYNTHHLPLTTGYHYKPIVYHYKQPYVAESAGKVKHTVLKREADPLFYQTYMPHFYSGVYASHPVYQPIVSYKPSHAEHKLGKGVYSNDAVSSFGYAAKGKYMADSVGAKHIAKREADPYFYSAYMTPTVYTHGSYMHHAAPIMYTKPAMPYFQAKVYANDAEKPFDYAAKGKYHAENAGAKHIAKREAEPFFYSAGINSHIYGTGYTFPYSTYNTAGLYYY